MSLRSYIDAAPKAELHVHLEGAIQPQTLLDLARRRGVALPAADLASLREWFRFRDFDHFVRVYLAIAQCLRESEDFELIVYEFGREMARQHIRYAEATFSPGLHRWLGVSEDLFLPGLIRGRERAMQDFKIEINWVFDLVRNASNPEYFNDYVTQIAIDSRGHGVVALGLGGKEEGYPPEPFAPWFDRALAAGLHSDPHAGETLGAASVRGAIEALGAERIGHGVRAIEDPDLVAELAARRIPLEINPTSNIRLGIYPTMREHPLGRLHEAGVVITVNSDDPPLFNTTLTDEIALLVDTFGFDASKIDEILLNAVRHSFLPAERKEAMLREFEGELTRLKSVHLDGGADAIQP